MVSTYIDIYLSKGHQIVLEIILQGSKTPPVATTIFFGANDAALAGRTSDRQHVPVEEYAENLRRIVNHLKVQISFTLEQYVCSIQFNIYYGVCNL